MEEYFLSHLYKGLIYNKNFDEILKRTTFVIKVGQKAGVSK